MLQKSWRTVGVSPPVQESRRAVGVSPPVRKTWRTVGVSPPVQESRQAVGVSPPVQKTWRTLGVSPPVHCLGDHLPTVCKLVGVGREQEPRAAAHETITLQKLIGGEYGIPVQAT